MVGHVIPGYPGKMRLERPFERKGTQERRGWREHVSPPCIAYVHDPSTEARPANNVPRTIYTTLHKRRRDPLARIVSGQTDRVRIAKIGYDRYELVQGQTAQWEVYP